MMAADVTKWHTFSQNRSLIDCGTDRMNLNSLVSLIFCGFYQISAQVNMLLKGIYVSSGHFL